MALPGKTNEEMPMGEAAKKREGKPKLETSEQLKLAANKSVEQMRTLVQESLAVGKELEDFRSRLDSVDAEWREEDPTLRTKEMSDDVARLKKMYESVKSEYAATLTGIEAAQRKVQKLFGYKAAFDKYGVDLRLREMTAGMERSSLKEKLVGMDASGAALGEHYFALLKAKENELAAIDAGKWEQKQDEFEWIPQPSAAPFAEENKVEIPADLPNLRKKFGGKTVLNQKATRDVITQVRTAEDRKKKL